MSLMPFFEYDPWYGLRGPLHLFDQNFGLGMDLSDLIQPNLGRVRSGYYRPWRHVDSQQGGRSSVSMNKEGFHVMMDVQQFSPNEVTVKVVDNHVVVEGKHEEKSDEHGYVSRHFVRRYVLPKNVNAEAITSSLSSDGVLTITAPKDQALEEGNARTIPITQTGAPAIKDTGAKPVKQREPEKDQK